MVSGTGAKGELAVGEGRVGNTTQHDSTHNKVVMPGVLHDLPRYAPRGLRKSVIEDARWFVE